MEFNKNNSLIQDICLVQIKSIDDVVSIPNLTTIYHTPSKITYKQSSKVTDAGVLITKTLSLSYPGLSTTDFEKFNDLLRGVYQVYVKTTTHDIYEVASNKFFMQCSSSFDIKKGHTLVFKNASPVPVKFHDNQTAEGINIDGFDYHLDFNLS
ncbi:hypothetical protein [Thalassobellus citreus]|uniref:hypothetical protein n=1 Tax=Thalassobellus citreus TaxID=3367752 RepID=UPI0037AFDF79